MVIRRKLHDKNDTIESLDSRIAQRKYHGKVIVSAIAITNVLESIPLCFIGEFNIVQLLIQPILLIALLFGVRWVCPYPRIDGQKKEWYNGMEI